MISWWMIIPNGRQSLDQFFDPFEFVDERPQVVSQVHFDEGYVLQGQVVQLNEDLLHGLLRFVNAGRVDAGDVNQEFSFLVPLVDVLLILTISF